MTELPLVSIVTPSYNQAHFIEATIRSILEQDYPNIEYIIMDGGSTDGSNEIIRRYASHLAYWVSESDRGQSDAINRGFERSTGQILAWLNSDDTYEPGAIQAVVNTFLTDPKTRLVYGEGWYIDAVGDRIRPCKFVRSHFIDLYIANKDPILQQSAFWRRDLWNEIGPLNESLNWVFDWDWFIRAYQHTEFHYLPRFLANYRVHPASKTRSGDIYRRTELRDITRRYGAWWHPNAIVQQLYIWSHHAPTLLKPAAYFLCQVAKTIFYERFTT